MARSKTEVKASVPCNTSEVMSQAVEVGIARGWTRAHKHTDTPDPASVKATIQAEVEASLWEVFEFWYPGKDE